MFEFEGPPLYFEISSYRSVMMIHKAAILFFFVGPIVTEKVMPQTDHQLQRFRGYAHTNENSLSISWPLNLNLFFMNIFCFFLFLSKCRMGRRKGKNERDHSFKQMIGLENATLTDHGVLIGFWLGGGPLDGDPPPYFLQK